MKKDKKQMKKNKFLLITFIWLLIIIIFFSISVIHIYYKDLDYKKSISIKLGEELPTIINYVNDENLEKLDSTKIEWENIKLDDNKIYSAGDYTGYIIFRNKKIKLNLQVIDDEDPNIEGTKDLCK